MPAFTSFLNLYKPGGGSTGLITPDEVVDVDRINQNSDLIDAWAVKVGNESTRQVHYAGLAAAMGGALVPPPKDGDTYQETDGNKILWRRVGGLWVTNENGAYLIRPASVTNGTVEADGSVVPTVGAATCSLTGIFSSRFRKYRIDFYIRCAANQTHSARLRRLGADVVTGDYSWNTLEGSGTTAGFATFTAQSSWNISPKEVAQNNWGSLELTNPAHSGANYLKTFIGHFSGAFSNTSYATRSGFLSNFDANTFDAITFITSSTFQAPSYYKVYGLA